MSTRNDNHLEVVGISIALAGFAVAVAAILPGARELPTQWLQGAVLFAALLSSSVAVFSSVAGFVLFLDFYRTEAQATTGWAQTLAYALLILGLVIWSILSVLVTFVALFNTVVSR